MRGRWGAESDEESLRGAKGSMDAQMERDSIDTSAIRSSSSGPSALPNLRPSSRHNRVLPAVRGCLLSPCGRASQRPSEHQ